EPATGYNFDRLTCESCKAFFRRNALKSRERIKPCSRGGGCDVSGPQRKHCPTCRLEKCLRVGMKKELILPPEKLEQRAKPKKRTARQQLQLPWSSSESAAAAASSPRGGVLGVHNRDSECLDGLREAQDRLSDALQMSDCDRPDGGEAKDGVGRLEQAFNQMEACIRRIISVVKLIPIFSEVDKDSQILMLKESQRRLSGSGGVSLMRELAAAVAAIVSMHPGSSDLTLADLDQYCANSHNVYARLELYSRHDSTVKMLMLALKLFNTDSMPASPARDSLERAQSFYSLLLKKYLAREFGVPDAMQLYPRLLLTFIDMRTVENKMVEFTRLLSVESLNPLVREFA
uniref:Nuclear receptor n=1 Tax=Macrostomum lignano TaxID=282301 RepID=A0A1I8JEC9_9PLAT